VITERIIFVSRGITVIACYSLFFLTMTSRECSHNTVAAAVDCFRVLFFIYEFSSSPGFH